MKYLVANLAVLTVMVALLAVVIWLVVPAAWWIRGILMALAVVAAMFCEERWVSAYVNRLVGGKHG